jgi:hypothetical protein
MKFAHRLATVAATALAHGGLAIAPSIRRDLLSLIGTVIVPNGVGAEGTAAD